LGLISNVIDAVAGGPPKRVKITGTVADVFAHRFVVQTSTVRVLADIGPKGAETIKIKQTDRVDIEGEQKPTEIKVQRISLNGGEMRETGPGSATNPDFSPADATDLARRSGYEILGEPRPCKKHYEAVAKKDGTTLEIDIHREGEIKVKRVVDADELKAV
jgi:hypothetical protein